MICVLFFVGWNMYWLLCENNSEFSKYLEKIPKNIYLWYEKIVMFVCVCVWFFIFISFRFSTCEKSGDRNIGTRITNARRLQYHRANLYQDEHSQTKMDEALRFAKKASRLLETLPPSNPHQEILKCVLIGVTPELNSYLGKHLGNHCQIR